MSDIKLQDWPEGKRLRITYCHGKDEPRLITSYAGKWHFFEPVRVEIEPHPEGFYVPARDYDRQAAKIALLRARVAELEGLVDLRDSWIAAWEKFLTDPVESQAAEIVAKDARIAELEGVLRKAKQHFVADEPLKAFIEICAALGEKDE